MSDFLHDYPQILEVSGLFTSAIDWAKQRKGIECLDISFWFYDNSIIWC